MTTFEIREATQLDKNEIIAFGKCEFTRTFGHLYASIDLEQYLLDAFNENEVDKWFTDDSYMIFVGLAPDHAIVGYTLLAPCTLPIDHTNSESKSTPDEAGEVKKIYINPIAFGSGLVGELMKNGMNWLLKRYKDIYLGVWSENIRAIRFYEKCGFIQVGEHSFKVGNTYDRDFIMKYQDGSKLIQIEK